MTAALVLVLVVLVALLRYDGIDRTKLLAARICQRVLAAYAAREATRRRRLVQRLAARELAREQRHIDRRVRRAQRDEDRYRRSEAWERWAATWSLELAAWVETQRRLADPLPPGQLPVDGETFDLMPTQNREGVE